MWLFRIAATLGVVTLVTSQSSGCKTFKQLRLRAGSDTTYKCLEECMRQSSVEPPINGTLLYHEMSEICLASLHAGALNASGGVVKVKKEHEVGDGSQRGQSRHGTCRNRICSNSIVSSGYVYKVSETTKVINGSVGGDVMLIHNNYRQNLRFLCLTEDNYGNRSVMKWNYKDLGRVNGNNVHAVQCAGRSGASDVLAAIPYERVKYKSLQHTWRCSTGEDLKISISKTEDNAKKLILHKLPDNPYFPSKQGKVFVLNSDSQSYSFTLNSTTPEDSGLYYYYVNEKEDSWESYFNILVRDCEAGKFGPECSKSCQECQNGGQCHSYTGECLCPPGFIGSACQHACPKGWFGTKCQFECGATTSDQLGPEKGSCKGLTLCLPSPMGCSCFPGYKGPMCDEDCISGTFGAGCLEKCSDKCNSNLCDPYTGSCYNSDNVLSTKAPTGVNVNDELLLSWRDEDPDGQHLYFVTLEVMKRCSRDQIGKTELHLVQPENQMQLPWESLQNSKFEVCVTTSDLTRGHSSPTCTSHVTPKEPNVKFHGAPSCPYNYERELRCKATIHGDCLNIYAGNFTVEFRLSSYLACNRTPIHYSESVTLQPSQMEVSQTFTNLIPGLQYNMTTSLIHNDSVIATAPDTLTNTTSSKLPQVENLTVAIIGEDTVRFMWNDPCPPNGEIGEYYFSYGYYHSPTSEHLSKSDTKCPKTIKYDGCHNSRGWKKGQYGGNYYYMFALNDRLTGEAAYYRFTMEETRPSTPEIILEEVNSAVIILPPKQPGGNLSRCNLIMGQESCEQMYREDEYMTCRFQDIQPGVIIKTQSWCCNEKFCGEKVTKELATMPAPAFSGSISVKNTTNTSITITLPQIIKEGDGTSTCFILVEHVIQDGERVHDLQAEAKMLIGRDKRNQRHKGDGPFWIAGNISRTTQQFEVGDGEEYDGFINHPLEEGEEYLVGLLCATKLLDKKAEIWQELDSPVTLSPPQTNMLLIIIIAVVLLLFLMMIPVYIYKNPDKLVHIRSRVMAAPDTLTRTSMSASTPAVRSRSPSYIVPSSFSMSSLANIKDGPLPQNVPLQENTGDECIYANVSLQENAGDECIYANMSRRIPFSEVERYLNMTINSEKALQEFKIIPDYLKDMTVGTQPSNKKKNRYRNNLPYDETRVKLSIINGDPSSDYINANHIQGYSSIKYIATQGPMDQSLSTVKDFWRMIVEQQVTAIIMVSSFEEGQSKVAQYMNYEETLEFGNYPTQVVSSLQRPHFTVSQIQVFVDGKPEHIVTHYHYTNWPDHGVPDEEYSISYLITFFLNTHDNGGGVVVHSSAGTGRTGSVLMVLLLHEMLKIEGNIDPIEVLIRLRGGRGHLVENIDQYNLALMITEELLFGNITAVTPFDLKNNLRSLLPRASSEFEKVKSMLTPLSYRYSSSQAVRHLNRNPDILPSDNHRVYLQKTNGEESQYINAVQIHGFKKKDRFLVTEHPLRETQARFWRMIMEKRCPCVVLINHYAENSEEEFPSILPEDGKVMNVSGYKITVCSPVPSGSDLMEYTVTVENPGVQGLCHTLTAYVVLNWEHGSPTPGSPNVLLNLADKLLQPGALSNPGPTLLCCGDGVTGCGLLVGLIFILQRVHNEDVADIYRAVVKLLRYRYQFITCKEQYAMLYYAASNYLKDFPTYVVVN